MVGGGGIERGKAESEGGCFQRREEGEGVRGGGGGFLWWRERELVGVLSPVSNLGLYQGSK